MNARVPRGCPRFTEVGLSIAEPGTRYSALEVARAWGVDIRTVVGWIERGWLRASHTTNRGYRIRLRALRRLALDYPSVAETVMEARTRAIRRKGGELP